MSNDKPWIGLARVPQQAGYVRAIQVYYDGVNDKKVVLQCENGNWVYEASVNAIVPLMGKQNKIIVQGDKIVKA